MVVVKGVKEKRSHGSCSHGNGFKFEFSQRLVILAFRRTISIFRIWAISILYLNSIQYYLKKHQALIQIFLQTVCGPCAIFVSTPVCLLFLLKLKRFSKMCLLFALLFYCWAMTPFCLTQRDTGNKRRTAVVELPETTSISRWKKISWTNNHTKWSCKRRVERNAFHFFLSGAKRILPLPSVPEERERHHSVATMTNIQGSKEPNRKISLMRRSTRWTLLASDVEVMPICSLKGRYQVHCVVKGLIHLTYLFRAIFDWVKKEIRD